MGTELSEKFPWKLTDLIFDTATLSDRKTKMKTISWTEFKDNKKKYIDLAKAGERIQVKIEEDYILPLPAVDTFAGSIEHTQVYDKLSLKNGGWRLLKEGEECPWLKGYFCAGYKHIDYNGVALKTNILLPNYLGNPWLKADGTLSETLCYEDPRYDGPAHAFRREQVKNGELK